MDLKLKSSDADCSDTLQRSCAGFPLSAKVLDLIREEKKSFAEVAKIDGKNEFSVREIVRKEKKLVLVLLSNIKLRKLQPQHVMSALGKRGNTLNFCNKIVRETSFYLLLSLILYFTSFIN